MRIKRSICAILMFVILMTMMRFPLWANEKGNISDYNTTVDIEDENIIDDVFTEVLSPDISVSIIPADTNSITNGIKQFQQYINNNLPISYLGTKLEIDGGFGILTQQAFLRYVGYIERYSSGNWVYILQGLLYGNNYDPNGFDGSYGVNGGTGCLNAVTSFKNNNNIAEGSTGSVGLQTMMKLFGRSFVQDVSNAAYYIRLGTILAVRF